MMNGEGYGWHKMNYAEDGTQGWQNVNDPNGNLVTVVDDTHPIVVNAGLTAGPIAYLQNEGATATTAAVSVLTPSAANIASIMINDIEYAIVFAIDEGMPLAKDPNLMAPARIVGFSLPGNQDPDLSDEGWALFDAAIRWLDPAPQVLTVGPIDSMTATGDKGLILSINGIDVNDMVLGTSMYADPDAASRPAERADDFNLDVLASADGQAYMQTLFDQAVDTIFLVEFRGDDSGYVQALDVMGDPIGGMVPFGPDNFGDTGYLAYLDQVSKALVIRSEMPIYGFVLLPDAEGGLGIDPLSIAAVPAP